MDIVLGMKLISILATGGKTPETARRFVNEVWAMTGRPKQDIIKAVRALPPEKLEELINGHKHVLEEGRKAIDGLIKHDPAFGYLIKKEFDNQIIEIFGRPIL